VLCHPGPRKTANIRYLQRVPFLTNSDDFVFDTQFLSNVSISALGWATCRCPSATSTRRRASTSGVACGMVSPRWWSSPSTPCSGRVWWACPCSILPGPRGAWRDLL